MQPRSSLERLFVLVISEPLPLCSFLFTSLFCSLCISFVIGDCNYDSWLYLCSNLHNLYCTDAACLPFNTNLTFEEHRVQCSQHDQSKCSTASQVSLPFDRRLLLHADLCITLAVALSLSPHCLTTSLPHCLTTAATLARWHYHCETSSLPLPLPCHTITVTLSLPHCDSTVGMADTNLTASICGASWWSRRVSFGNAVSLELATGSCDCVVSRWACW